MYMHVDTPLYKLVNTLLYIHVETLLCVHTHEHTAIYTYMTYMYIHMNNCHIYIPYSGKLWQALNLANQSPE